MCEIFRWPEFLVRPPHREVRQVQENLNLLTTVASCASIGVTGQSSRLPPVRAIPANAFVRKPDFKTAPSQSCVDSADDQSLKVDVFFCERCGSNSGELRILAVSPGTPPPDSQLPLCPCCPTAGAIS
jgi:hypothetical protein